MIFVILFIGVADTGRYCVNRQCARRSGSRGYADFIGIYLNIGQNYSFLPFEERILIPEILIGTSYTGCTRLDRVGYTAVPPEVSAGSVGCGSPAAYLVEAPALFGGIVVRLFDELPRVEESASVAGVVNPISEELFRPTLVV